MIMIAVCDNDYILTTEIEDILYGICIEKSIQVDLDVFYSGIELEK